MSDDIVNKLRVSILPTGKTEPVVLYAEDVEKIAEAFEDSARLRDELAAVTKERDELRMFNAAVYGTSHPEIYKTTEDERIERLEAELAAERERASKYQRLAAELSDKLNGTPCAEIRWQHEREEVVAAERGECAKIADVRAAHYAQAANEHEDDELGCVYTDKAGVASSIAAMIRRRP